MPANVWQGIAISLLLVLFLSGAEHPGHFISASCQFFFAHPALSKGGKEQWEVFNVNQVARVYDLLDDKGERKSTVVVFANGRAVAYTETLDNFVTAWRRCSEIEKH